MRNALAAASAAATIKITHIAKAAVFVSARKARGFALKKCWSKAAAAREDMPAARIVACVKPLKTHQYRTSASQAEKNKPVKIANAVFFKKESKNVKDFASAHPRASAETTKNSAKNILRQPRA